MHTELSLDEWSFGEWSLGESSLGESSLGESSLGEWNLADIEITLTTRAWNDEAFRARLLRDPKATIEREMGCRLHPSLKLSIHQETPGHRHIVIPAPPPADD